MGLSNSHRRRLTLAVGIYALTTAIFFLLADHSTLVEHTRYNHFALQAEAWLDGTLHLPGGPPPYAGANDFARFEGRWYVVFPPLPAVLLVPLVALAGSALRVQDGQFFIWLAGVAPSVLFLALDKLRRSGRSDRTERDSVLLALLFAFGTVYFFTAEQGTVWFAAHVVGAALAALYLLFALDAQRPVLAGAMLGLGLLTRAPLLFAFPLFVLEAVRVCRVPAPDGAPAVDDPVWWRRLLAKRRGVDNRRLARLLLAFFAPAAAAVVLALWHNVLRFGNPFDFGYEHLVVAWQGRIHKWGLFHYHYLARNLGVVLTSLPYLPPPGSAAPAPFRINGHGLALWVTSPFFVWLVWPRRTGGLHLALWVTVAAVALPTLLYQNTGWVQFGYRFSNDYVVFLVALLAIGGRRFDACFWATAGLAVAVNAFGALSFNRAEYAKYYFIDTTQRILYQPD